MSDHVTRRGVLAAGGLLATSGLAGLASAGNHGEGNGNAGDPSDLRLFSEAAVDNSHEVDTDGKYAYVATGDGMGVADWRNPGKPEVVASLDASDPAGGILDVKVDGDLASLASNGGPGITLVDVSDPENPEEITFYDAGHDVHNNFLYKDHAYLTINESGSNTFSEARTDIVDVSDPSDPKKVGEWRLADHFPEFAAAGVNPNHDVYVQDDLLYQAYWDAGVVIADVSDPSNPTTVAQFGDVAGADTPQPDSFPVERYYTAPGNAHYVQPSPDGDHVYVGPESFPGLIPGSDNYGQIRVYDVTDMDDPELVSTIQPPDVDAFRTAHNFDVTANELHASWYSGGVRIYDITDPTNPTEKAVYDPDGYSFWGAVSSRGFTIGAVYGASSSATAGGLTVLHDDRGKKRPPGFDGAAPPEDPGMGVEEET
ncbi:LVIVD repeat-containing protein [Salinigranum sp.]|uniref:LVIVD repeat-containing protein n=1 Tax=Salinigranum sp. TaxID=1966351 RepID=UPI0035684651